MNWNKYPFIRMVGALALGIVICDRVGERPLGEPWLVGLLVLLLAVEVLLHHLLRSFRYRWIFGIMTLITFIWLGFVRTAVMQQSEVVVQEEGWRLARVLEPPEEREKTVKVLLELDQGKAMAYFQKDERSLDLSYGDYIGFSVPLVALLMASRMTWTSATIWSPVVEVPRVSHAPVVTATTGTFG